MGVDYSIFFDPLSTLQLFTFILSYCLSQLSRSNIRGSESTDDKQEMYIKISHVKCPVNISESKRFI